MTLKKLIAKYDQMTKDGYEFVSIQQVILDLRNARRIKN